MIRFRNLIVHRYEKIEAGILVDIVNHHLSDLERFRNEIRAYVEG